MSDIGDPGENGDLKQLSVLTTVIDLMAPPCTDLSISF